MNSITGLLTRINPNPSQCGGRPCIRGMRIQVTNVLNMLAENVDATEILEDFPDAVITTKYSDFIDRVCRLGATSQILWLTCGDVTNRNLRQLLAFTLPDALE